MTRRDSPAPLSGELDDLDAFSQALDRARHSNGSSSQRTQSQANDTGHRLAADPENVEQGLAKLVLSVIELLRQLLEQQGVRRMDQGDLSDEEIERMGATFLALSEKMDELKAEFGLDDEDLELQLGRLEDLISDDRD